MKKNKLVTISIVLIMTLAFCGIAYAHWFDQIHIEGETKGGTVNIAFGTNIPMEPPQVSEFHQVGVDLVPGEFMGKEVAETTAEYRELETDVHTEKIGYKYLDIDIECAYPSYFARTTFVVHNIGTIPVNICGILLTGEKREKDGDPGTWLCDLIYVPDDPNVPYIGEMWEDWDGSGDVTTGDKLVMNIRLPNKMPYQLDPCNEHKHEFDIHFKQDSQQCHRYTLHIKIFALQWNKLCPAVIPPD